MSEQRNVRWVWLKVMYIWTIVVAGGFGLGMILVPETIKAMFNDVCDPLGYGIQASVFLAFGLLSILGLRDPLKFVPVLLLQLTYKVVWFVGVVLPFVVTGRAEPEMLIFVIFALTIVGDLIAIPFPYVFAQQSDA